MVELPLDVEQIKDLLPHRFPFLLVDRVIELSPAHDELVAIKNVTNNEPFFNGHFPGCPVMPGVLIIEALAQASAVLYKFYQNNHEQKDDRLTYLATIDNARFRQVVVPGDQLHLNVKVKKGKKDIGVMHGTGLVDGKVVCEVEFMSVRR